MPPSKSRSKPPLKPRKPEVVVDTESPVARTVVSVVVAVCTVLVLTNLNESYALPKATVLALGAFGLVALAGWHVATRGELRYPVGPTVLVVGGVLLFLTLATVVNPHPAQSFFGEYGRSAGLLTYASAAVLFVVVLRSHRPTTLPGLAWVMVGASVPVVLYGLLQAMGSEPLGLEADVQSVVSTLGQVNFVGGYAGIALPFVLWAATGRGRSLAARVALAALVLGLAVLAVKSRSFQALPAMAAAVLIFGGAYAVQRVPGRRLLQAAAAVVLVLVLGAAVTHSELERQVRSGLNERVLLWQAAGGMIADHPVIGVGPAGYAADFTEYRPEEHARQFGLLLLADAPHSVPLEMFVAGGVPLGLLYLAFVGLTGAALFLGLRRTTGDEQLLLAAFGGAWAAYQVQSLVSIDFPTLVIGHFVTAAAILVLSGRAPVRVRSLAGLAPQRRGRQVVPSAAGQGLRVVVVLAALVAAWFAIRPVRADMAHRQALDQAASGQTEAALASTKRAVSIAPWLGPYWAKRASVLVASGDQEAALVAGERAATRLPSAVSYALSAAQLAHRMGRDAEAEHWFAVALEHGPYMPEPLGAEASYFSETGKYERAIGLAKRALALRPGSTQYLEVLGLAQAAAGHVDDAIATFELQLAADPSIEQVNENLAVLYERAKRPADALKAWERVLAINHTNQAAIQALGLE